MFLLGILSAIFILLVIIAVHEAGHFFAARYFGMQTPVVGLGLPFWGPTWKIGRYKDVEFRFHPVLLGAYVAIPEMDDESVNEMESLDIKLADTARSFPAWQRMIVSFAGPFANFILALLIAIFSAFAFGEIEVTHEDIVVQSVSSDAAQITQNSLQKGDIITDLNNEEVHNFAGFVEKVQANKGKEIILEVQRGEAFQQFTLPVSSEGMLGITLQQANQELSFKPIEGNSILGPLNYAITEFNKIFMGSLMAIGQLLAAPFQALFGVDNGIKAENLHGIVKVTQSLAEIFEQQAALLPKIWALLSVYIGLINLVPMLPLDGGHILFQLLEIIGIRKGETLNKVRDYYAQFGLFLIFGLLILVMFNDLQIAKLLQALHIFK